jgi:TonB family protein
MARRLAASLLLITLTSMAAAQAAPPRVRVSSGVMQSLLVKKVQPEYPGDAKRIQGMVVLKATIDKDGNISDLQLISGHPMLAAAAIAAVKQWKYKPYLLNGVPVEVETNLTVNFTLADSPPADGDARNGEPIGELSASGAKGVRVSQSVMQSFLVKKVQPEYPADAKGQHIQGVVLLNVNIDKEGNVSNIQLISGHPALAPAAVEAVKQWKYRPYSPNGSPLEVETQVQVNYTLAE